MLVLTEPQEVVCANLAGQAKLVRTHPEPLAGHTLSFIIVITDTEVFFKVFPGILQIVLCLGRNHGGNCAKMPSSFCVGSTQNDPEKLLHWWV
jgi:hypothetical protein